MRLLTAGLSRTGTPPLITVTPPWPQRRSQPPPGMSVHVGLPRCSLTGNQRAWGWRTDQARPIGEEMPMSTPRPRLPPHRHRCPVCTCQWEHRTQRCRQQTTRICPPCQHSQGSSLLDMPRTRAQRLTAEESDSHGLGDGADLKDRTADAWPRAAHPRTPERQGRASAAGVMGRGRPPPARRREPRAASP
jgi:hypothetical protein